jgi:kynureninase
MDDLSTRDSCLACDRHDPLAPLRDEFALEAIDAQGVIYLDGNSLGVLPKATRDRVRQVVDDEWGTGLIRSWNDAGWVSLSQRIADKIGRLIGARAGEVVVADSTSVNLYKVLSAAIALVESNGATHAASNAVSTDAVPRRNRIVSERTNFPSDIYIADGLARAHGLELVLVDADDLAAHLDDRLAILMLTHVNYRTGRMHRMADVTRAAHAAGGLVVWDLAHSAGAMPVDLRGRGRGDDAAADFAIGCGYKYLNGGPGAPAFAWAHPRHTAWMDLVGWSQPLAGWFGHAAPFEFTTEYRPGAGMTRFNCGTPPVLSLAALECGVDTVLAAERFGGLDLLRMKSTVLTTLFITLARSRCAGYGLHLATPLDPDERGSQVSFAHGEGGYAIMQALIARGVIGDFREPDLMRFGFTPLYTRYVDVWDAVDRLAQVLASGEWRDPRFAARAAVT